MTRVRAGTYLEHDKVVVGLHQVAYLILVEDAVVCQGGGGFEGTVLAVHKERLLLAPLHEQDVEHLLLQKHKQPSFSKERKKEKRSGISYFFCKTRANHRVSQRRHLPHLRNQAPTVVDTGTRLKN